MTAEEQSARGLRDIARLAGVSHQTVSRVLNGRPNISTATRERVLAVVEAQNFRPNRVARALTTRRHGRIGVVVDSANLLGPSSTLRAIEHAAYTRDLAVSSLTVVEDGGAGISEAVHHLRDHGIDGLIAIVPRTREVETIVSLARGLPTVLLNAEVRAVEAASALDGDHDEAATPHAALCAVSVDQLRGAGQASAHLIGLGHRVIMHLAGPRDWAESRLREQGWRQELLRAGLPVAPPLLGDWSADAGYTAAARVLERGDCTAVFAANDQMALGLLHGFHDAGVRVPEDISVVGFDDFPEARHLLPPLTTVRQDFVTLGTTAVATVAELIEDPQHTPEPQRLDAELIVRASTAPPRR